MSRGKANMSSKNKTDGSVPFIISEENRSVTGEGFGMRVPIDSEWVTTQRVVGRAGGRRVLLTIRVESTINDEKPRRRSVQVTCEDYPEVLA